MAESESEGPQPEQPQGRIKELLNKILHRGGRVKSTSQRPIEDPSERRTLPGSRQQDGDKLTPPKPGFQQSHPTDFSQQEEFPLEGSDSGSSHTEASPKPSNPDLDRQLAAEAKRLAETYGTPDLTVLPERKWAVHYQNGPGSQTRAVNELLSGLVTPSAAIPDITPDSLLFNINDIQEDGTINANRLRQTEEKLMDSVSGVTNYDHQRFAEFVSSMQGTHMTPAEAERIYGMIAADKAREIMLKTYDQQNHQRTLGTMAGVAETAEALLPQLDGMDQIMYAARSNHLLHHPQAHIRGRAPEQYLSDENQPFYDRIKNAYGNYVCNSDETAYRELVDTIHDYYMAERTEDDDQTSPQPPSPENLDDQANTQPSDSQGEEEAAPSDNQQSSESPKATDEYSQPTENPDSGPEFIITPPQTGYYVRERHTHYDTTTKTWSHIKKHSPYTRTSGGTERKTIAATVVNNVSSLLELPIPPEHIVDTASLEAVGQKPEIFRDETGTFYLSKVDPGDYTIDFLKEEPSANTIPPTADETVALYDGNLSDETEAFLSSLSGSIKEKASAIQKFLRQKHTYPDDPGAVQNGMRNGSTGDNYIQNLDIAPELECYSTATLFAALARHEDIPTRVIIGDHITKATGGQAVIDSTTKHAWNEIWDGGKWVTIDATPSKRNDQDDADESNEPGENGEESESGDKNNEKEQEQHRDTSREGKPSRQQAPQDGLFPQESASDEDREQGEANKAFADNAVDEAGRKRKELEEKFRDAESFKDLDNLRNEIEDDPELFDDMKKELQEKADAIEEQNKQEIKDKLDKMEEEGFLEADRRRELEDLLEDVDTADLDALKEQIEFEARAFQEFEDIKESMQDVVDETYDRLVEILPRVERIETDEDEYGEEGDLDTDSLRDPGKMLFGEVFNPRVIKPEIRPLFIADMMVDVSGSMGNDNKIDNAKKLVIFFNELFSRLQKDYGYIRYSVSSFSDDIMTIKTFDQDYESPERYEYEHGEVSTVKARTLKGLEVRGGTDILSAVKKSANSLEKESEANPDYASALYFIGDGEDSGGRERQIKGFLDADSDQGGFGHHMRSAIMLGDEQQRIVLARLFGADNTAVANDLGPLIDAWLNQFESDVQFYFQDKLVA